MAGSLSRHFENRNQKAAGWHGFANARNQKGTAEGAFDMSFGR
jgi:hypothetical protein